MRLYGIHYSKEHLSDFGHLSKRLKHNLVQNLLLMSGKPVSLHLLMSQTLSSGQKSELTNGQVNSSKQAILIRSGVAGVSKGNHSLPRPTSARAALTASLIANKTDDARKNGGSPTALDECIPFEFGFP